MNSLEIWIFLNTHLSYSSVRKFLKGEIRFMVIQTTWLCVVYTCWRDSGGTHPVSDEQDDVFRDAFLRIRIKLSFMMTSSNGNIFYFSLKTFMYKQSSCLWFGTSHGALTWRNWKKKPHLYSAGCKCMLQFLLPWFCPVLPDHFRSRPRGTCKIKIIRKLTDDNSAVSQRFSPSSEQSEQRILAHKL